LNHVLSEEVYSREGPYHILSYNSLQLLVTKILVPDALKLKNLY
jgi:hypothetical protein